MYKCPVCGSNEIRGSEHSVERPEGSPISTVKEFEFFCTNCKTLESRRDNQTDFVIWRSRWAE